MIPWLRRILRLKPEQQLSEIEANEPSLEARLDRLVSRLGGYKHKDAHELNEIIDDLNVVLDIVERIVTKLENIGGQDRARELMRRLKNNRTRAENARRNLEVA